MNKPNKEMTLNSRTTKIFLELPEWVFDVNEVSGGVYEVIGQGRACQTIHATGLEPDALIEKCKATAIDMMTGRAPQANADAEQRGKDAGGTAKGIERDAGAECLCTATGQNPRSR